MDAKWNPRRRGRQSLRNNEDKENENVWSKCSEEDLERMKAEYDRERFGDMLVGKYIHYMENHPDLLHCSHSTQELRSVNFEQWWGYT